MTSSRRIEIVDYDPAWPERFDALAACIREAAGAHLLRIDHIGSTAVPGLAAKDVLDVQVTVRDLDAPGWRTAMEQAGFRVRPHVTHDSLVGLDDDDPELSKRFLHEPEGQRPANLHVREAGRLNQRYPLLFRDYLRADPVVRDAYERIKRVLAARFPDDADAYYEIKDPLMDAIFRGAGHWAATTGWTPGPDAGAAAPPPA